MASLAVSGRTASRPCHWDESQGDGAAGLGVRDGADPLAVISEQVRCEALLGLGDGDRVGVIVEKGRAGKQRKESGQQPRGQTGIGGLGVDIAVIVAGVVDPRSRQAGQQAGGDVVGVDDQGKLVGLGVFQRPGDVKDLDVVVAPTVKEPVQVVPGWGDHRLRCGDTEISFSGEPVGWQVSIEGPMPAEVAAQLAAVVAAQIEQEIHETIEWIQIS